MWRRIACAVLAALVVLVHPMSTFAVCRVVAGTSSEGDLTPIEFDPRTMVMYVLAPDQIVGYRCPDVVSPDAGVPSDGAVEETADDGGAPGDGGELTPLDGDVADLDASVDADASIDGDLPTDVDAAVAPKSMIDAATGGAGDAGFPPVDMDAGLADLDASVEPPMPRCPDDLPPEPVYGSLVHVVVQPQLIATGATAGLIMPVPARPDVHVSGSAMFFEQIGALMTPRETFTTIEVEDPSLGRQCDDPHFSSYGSGAGCGGSDDGGYYDDRPATGTSGDYYDPDTTMRETTTIESGDGIVEVEHVIATDDFDVSVVSASTVDALYGWLDARGFAHDEDDDRAFEAYTAEEAWFVAIDVHPEAYGRTTIGLAPIVISFPGREVPIAHRLQYDPDGGTFMTDAFVVAPTRMEVADGSGLVRYAAFTDFGGSTDAFGVRSAWLTRLDITRVAHVWLDDSSLVPTSNVEQRPTIEHITTVQIPVRCAVGSAPPPPPRSSSSGCLCAAGRPNAPLGDAVPIACALAFLIVRTRSKKRRRA
jgi:hypothetical protein